MNVVNWTNYRSTQIKKKRIYQGQTSVCQCEHISLLKNRTVLYIRTFVRYIVKKFVEEVHFQQTNCYYVLVFYITCSEVLVTIGPS